jgi:Ras-related protein Rab-8A
MGILLVYDVTDSRSFNNIREWLENIKKHGKKDVNTVLLGNKSDILDKRVVRRDEGQALAGKILG